MGSYCQLANRNQPSISSYQMEALRGSSWRPSVRIEPSHKPLYEMSLRAQSSCWLSLQHKEWLSFMYYLCKSITLIQRRESAKEMVQIQFSLPRQNAFHWTKNQDNGFLLSLVTSLVQAFKIHLRRSRDKEAFSARVILPTNGWIDATKPRQGY